MTEKERASLKKAISVLMRDNGGFQEGMTILAKLYYGPEFVHPLDGPNIKTVDLRELSRREDTET